MSKMWHARILKRHPELKRTYVKALDKARRSFEASDVQHIKDFFTRLQEIIWTFRIGASETWNEDECGIRIGCLREHVQVIIMRTSRNTRG